MEKVLKQYRYYGEGSPLNYPSDLTKNQLISGEAFFSNKTNYISMAALGIQTSPGVQFRLNEAPEADYIIIGNSGIFELDIDDSYEITDLKFNRKSLEMIEKVDNSTYLIVDVIYNTEG